MGFILDLLKANLDAVVAAPWAFALILGIAVFIAYKFADWHRGGTLSNLKEENRQLKEIKSEKTVTTLPNVPASASPFHFFPNRAAMGQFRKLGDVLRESESIKMIVVGASAFVEGQLTVGNLKKVIFPHPRSPSLQLYAESIGDSSLLRGKIETATDYLISKGVEVKWYPHMINHAVIIANHDRQSGWVQWESVLPYVPFPSRPSVIVYKPTFEPLISAINDSFDKMFGSSNTPTPYSKGEVVPHDGYLRET